MVEMNEAANILNNVGDRSLILMDELGRGTSTFDGLSIAWSIVEHLHQHGRARPRTLFATHYHEMTALEEQLERVQNFNVVVLEEGDRVVFLHRLAPGPADRSYGINVAQMAGMPHGVVRRAKDILARLEGEQIDVEQIHGLEEGAPGKASVMPEEGSVEAREVSIGENGVDTDNAVPQLDLFPQVNGPLQRNSKR